MTNKDEQMDYDENPFSFISFCWNENNNGTISVVATHVVSDQNRENSQ